MLQKIKKLEVEKVQLQEHLEKEKAAMEIDMPDRKSLELCFLKAQKLFRSKKLEEQQVLINLYVERIIVHQDQVEVILNLVSFIYRQEFTKIIYSVDRQALRKDYYEVKGKRWSWKK